MKLETVYFSETISAEWQMVSTFALYIYIVDAMKGWTIKKLDEIIQDYLIDMETIPENPDDIGALDVILFEDDDPSNSLI